MRDIGSKKRLLKVLEILEKYTDEDHFLSVSEMKEKLKLEFGSDYAAGKKALQSDIQALQETGYDITEDKGEFGAKVYNYPNRLFELHELRMLIDAVMYAKFIPKEDSKNLIEKLQKQTSQHISKKLQEQIKYLDLMVKVDNRKLKNYVHSLHTAVTESKMVRFQYGKYNMKKEFILNKDGDWYEVKPYALIWWKENYYLIAMMDGEKDVRHYRVDRMRNVTVTDQKFKKESFNYVEHYKKSFYMFHGEEKTVKIQFENENNDFINIVIDEFGKDVDIQIIDEHSFIATISANVSQGLISWLLNWGSKAKVLSPPELVEDMKAETQKMFQLYQTIDVPAS